MEKRERKPNGFWTKEECYRAAREYKTRKEFAENCCRGYQTARKNKWLDTYDWFEEKKKPSGFWTRERCYEAAREYNNKVEFRKNCGSAYNVARKNGWLDGYWWFERQQNPFTDKMDNVYCYHFIEFKSVYVGRTINPQERVCEHRIRGTVYNFAKKNKTEVPEMVLLETNLSLEDGLKLEDYYVNNFKKEGWFVLNKAKTGKDCGSIGRLGRGKWTKEKCYEAARECDSRSEFQKKCNGAYQVARKNNWLDDYDWFEEKHKPNGYWTKERCYEAALKHKNRSEFERNCGRGYTVALKNDWLSEYEWFEEKRKPKNFWTKEECYKAALKHKNRSEFERNCVRGYTVARKNGWLGDYYWFEEKHKPNGFWTKEECYRAASECGSRSEFREKYGRGYQVACKNNWLVDYDWFEEKRKQNGFWTKEKCYEAAGKCKNRSEFAKKYVRGYQTARRNGWLDELFPKNKKTA